MQSYAVRYGTVQIVRYVQYVKYVLYSMYSLYRSCGMYSMQCTVRTVCTDRTICKVCTLWAMHIDFIFWEFPLDFTISKSILILWFWEILSSHKQGLGIPTRSILIAWFGEIRLSRKLGLGTSIHMNKISLLNMKSINRISFILIVIRYYTLLYIKWVSYINYIAVAIDPFLGPCYWSFLWTA